MKWTEEQKCAINSVAKQAQKDLKEAEQAYGDDADKHIVSIIKPHYKKVAPYITFDRFSYHIGFLNGKLSRGL